MFTHVGKTMGFCFKLAKPNHETIIEDVNPGGLLKGQKDQYHYIYIHYIC